MSDEELRERIASAIIGACGTAGPSDGLLKSAHRQADRVIKALGFELVDFDEPEYEGTGAPHGECYVVTADLRVGKR